MKWKPCKPEAMSFAIFSIRVRDTKWVSNWILLIWTKDFLFSQILISAHVWTSSFTDYKILRIEAVISNLFWNQVPISWIYSYNIIFSYHVCLEIIFSSQDKYFVLCFQRQSVCYKKGSPCATLGMHVRGQTPELTVCHPWHACQGLDPWTNCVPPLACMSCAGPLN